MPEYYTPTSAERRALDELVAQVHDVQRTVVANHSALRQPDRAAHQQQLAGGRVVLHVADRLPGELDGLGIFQRGQGPRTGIGRISTGLGCPHAETDPDFLGLMAAFRAATRQRVDFVTINHPGAPTDTPEEFVALLKATADAARDQHESAALGQVASQARLLVGLVRHAGVRAPVIAAQVIRQTARTARSSSAIQPYWTGVVRARDVLGKFTFVPVEDVNGRRSPAAGPRHLSDDWRARQAARAIEFRLYWIPFLDERRTPLADLTTTWVEEHRVLVGSVTFPQTDPDTTDAKLLAILASEMGANPGNWIEDDRAGARSDLPATEYTAARFLAYRLGQQLRHALPDDAYASFLDSGTLAPELATELVRRYQAKRVAGHDVPNVGDVAVP
jgi:hypothetical protein